MSEGEESSPTAADDPEASLFMRLGVSGHRNLGTPIVVEPYPNVCAKGVIQPAVLVLLVDMLAGFYAEQDSGTDWIFTTDLSLRAPEGRIPARLEATGAVLRAGRSSVTSEVRVEAGGRPFAYGQAGFIRVPRRHGDPPKPHLHDETSLRTGAPLERPLLEEVGLEVVDPSLGHVELPLRDALRNPAGVVQGAIASLLAETAAESLADHQAGAPQRITDIDIRYLAMGRVGPLWTRAAWIGEPGSGSLRVEVRDRGNGDRMTNAVLIRTIPAG